MVLLLSLLLFVAAGADVAVVVVADIAVVVLVV